MPGTHVVYVVLYFMATCFAAIIGFLITLKVKGTRDPSKLWIHQEELIELQAEGVSRAAVDQIRTTGGKEV